MRGSREQYSPEIKKKKKKKKKKKFINIMNYK